jgi:hypothetical protein
MGLACLQGGTGSPATKAEQESRAGTWLDNACFTHFFSRCRSCSRLHRKRCRAAGGELKAPFLRLCSGDGHMLQALLQGRATNRAYKRAVDDCLSVLFCGFPHGLLPMLRRHVDISGLMRRGQAEGTDIRACSVQVVVLLIRKIIGSLSNRERQELARAFLQNDASNPTYKGFKCMFQVVEELNVSPALVSYVNTEVAGQLGGMSQQAIFNSWVEAQIGGVMCQLRERSREEAERNRDLWQ